MAVSSLTSSGVSESQNAIQISDAEKRRHGSGRCRAQCHHHRPWAGSVFTVGSDDLSRRRERGRRTAAERTPGLNLNAPPGAAESERRPRRTQRIIRADSAIGFTGTDSGGTRVMGEEVGYADALDAPSVRSERQAPAFCALLPAWSHGLSLAAGQWMRRRSNDPSHRLGEDVS